MRRIFIIVAFILLFASCSEDTQMPCISDQLCAGWWLMSYGEVPAIGFENGETVPVGYYKVIFYDDGSMRMTECNWEGKVSGGCMRGVYAVDGENITIKLDSEHCSFRNLVFRWNGHFGVIKGYFIKMCEYETTMLGENE